MKRVICNIIVLIALVCSIQRHALARNTQRTGPAEVSGLILPLDETGLCLRTKTGPVKVRWQNRTKVAIQLNYRNLSNVSDNKINYTIHSSPQGVSIPLPDEQAYAIKPFVRNSDLEAALEEDWVSCRDMSIVFGGENIFGLLSVDNPQLIGRFTFSKGRGKPAIIDVKGRRIEASMKKGGQTDVLIYNVWTIKDCKPFVNDATVIGRLEGDIILADEIHLRPIGDQVLLDDPKLPRYLFIGDSISGNYDKGLRKALKGKFNLHHPPTNCGPSGKGAARMHVWLGAHEVKGRGWDVISFNFGHWDAGNSKEAYQNNIEEVIGRLKKTGAKLIWVTTCPVPKGYPPAGELTGEGKAPGRTSGVMGKYLNPWAMEVIAKHPEIAVCDQWQFVKDHEDGIYKEWWKGKNVHFAGKQAEALGDLLAKKVLEVAEGNKPGR